MASLADELSAAMCSSKESTNESTSPQYDLNSENNKNASNIVVPPSNQCFRPLSDEKPYNFKLSESMDMTCDITMPAMKLTRNNDIASATTLSPQDITLDNNETIHGQHLSNLNEDQSNDQSKIDNSCDQMDSASCRDRVVNSIMSDDKANNLDNRDLNYETQKVNHCLWSHISTDFDPEEETANFGTRYAVENDGKLFDVITFATIEPKGEVRKYPLVLSCAAQNCLALVLDSCVHIFPQDFGSSAEETEVVSIDVGIQIDAICFSECTNFVFLALNNGSCQLVNIPTKTPLPALPIFDANSVKTYNHYKSFSSCWIEKDGELYSLSLLSIHGEVTVLKNVNLTGLNSALMKSDIGTLRTLQIQIHQDVTFNIFASSDEKEDKFDQDDNSEQNCMKQPIKVLSSAVISSCKDVPKIYFGSLNGELGRIEMENSERKRDCEVLELFNSKYDDNSIVHIAEPVNESFSDVVFALDEIGALHVVCSYTLLEIFVWKEEKVLDFVLFEEHEHLSIVMVTERCNTSDQEIVHTLQIREYPTFRPVYELIVNKLCKPLICPVGQESPLIIEGSNEGSKHNCGEVNNVLSALRIRGICEGNAEIRLGRLLRRNKFDEAEVVAKINKLDYEKIYQAKASWLMEKLSPWKVLNLEVDSSDDYDDNLIELKKILGRMKDLDYMVRCCVGAILPTLKDTRDLIVLARKATQQNLDKENFDHDLLSCVSSTLQRLETFIYTLKDHGISHSSMRRESGKMKENVIPIELIDKWASFSRADMLMTIGQFLAQGNLEAALLIWQRHQAEFTQRLSSEQIRLLLDLIKPEEYSCTNNESMSQKMQQWISQFIPDCMKIVPECLPTIADWITNATKRMELRDRKNWPLNGLTFAKTSLEAIHLDHDKDEENFKVNSMTSTRIPLTMYQQRSDKSSKLYNLINLIESLEDLMILHIDLKLRIKLDDFIQEDKTEVCIHLLDWCTNSDEVDALCDNFLLSFILRHNLDKVSILVNYCEKLMIDTGLCWYWELGSTAPWEDKVSTIMKYTSDFPTAQSKLILTALKYAPVPWTNVIKNLCEKGYHLPNSNLVKEQEKLVELKHILRKYHCRNLSVAGREAEAILKKVIKSEGTYQEITVIANLLHGIDQSTAKRFYVQHLLEDYDDDYHYKEAIQVIFESIADSDDFLIEVTDLANQILIRAKLLYKLEFEIFFGALNSDDRHKSGTAPYLMFFKDLLCKIESKFQPYTNQETLIELKKNIRRFVSQCNLRVKFGINIPEACSNIEAEEILYKKIEQLVEESINNNDASGLNVIYRMVQEIFLLAAPLCSQLTIDKLMAMIVIILAKDRKYVIAVEATKLIVSTKRSNNCSDTIQQASVLIELILRINSDFAIVDESADAGDSQNSLPSIMSTFAKMAVCTCKDENIIDNLFISKWQALMSKISEQFQNRNVFDKFEHSARLDGTNAAYESWKFSPIFIDKTLPLPDQSSLVVPSKFMTTLLEKKNEALPYMPLTIFSNKISNQSNQPMPDVKSNNLREPEILDSTSAVCTLTPPQPPTRTSTSPIVGKALINFSLISAEREEIFNTLSSDIVQHCIHHLTPMNQTMASIESLIFAEETLVALGLSFDDSTYLQMNPIMIKIEDMIFQESIKLFPRILSDKKPDLLLALSHLLTERDKKKGLKLLQKTNASFNFEAAEKIGTLGRLGMRYCAIAKLSQYFSSFRNLLVQSAWARKLVSREGHYKTLFAAKTQDDKMSVLQSLIEKSDSGLNVFSVMDVVQYSKAQDLDMATSLMLYINSILTSSLVEPCVQSQEINRSHLENVLNQHVSFALQSIPDNEKNDVKLKLIFDLFMTKVSPYNYEVLQFLLRTWTKLLAQSIEENHIKQEPEDESIQSNNDETYSLSNNIRENLSLLKRFEKMLAFLLNYQRVEEPTSEEIDYWHKSHPTVTLPSIAKIRLPFNYLSNKTSKETFKVLMKEFKLNNLDQWLTSAIEEKFVFRISPNNICIQTAQNEVKDLTDKSTRNTVTLNNNWIDKLKYIEECLVRITDLSHATSVSHWIINRLPEDRGCERLFCARMCRKFAEGWAEQVGTNDTDAKKGFIFAVTTQIRLEIEQILRKHKLFDDLKKQILLEFQKLESSKIIQLIQNLYDHSSIIERSRNIVSPKTKGENTPSLQSTCNEKAFPNVNDAVKEIASICNQSQDMFEINLDVIRYDLLDSLLKEKSGSDNSELDETVTNFSLKLLPGISNAQLNGNSSSEREHTNYLKCVYLLQGFEDNKGIDYLLQIAMDEGLPTNKADMDITSNFSVACTNRSTMHKLRSLKCLLSVATTDELEKMGCSVFEDEHVIERRFHNYGFVSRLESLNLPAYDLASFENCDKTALIEGILRICSYSAKGISVIIDLCLAYGVFKSSLWTGLIGKMISQNLWKELRCVLLELNGHPAMWNLPIFLDAWNQSLSEPFTRASLPVTPEQRKKCFDALKLIKSCPVAADLEIDILMGECNRLGLDDIADELLVPLKKLTNFAA